MDMPTHTEKCITFFHENLKLMPKDDSLDSEDKILTRKEYEDKVVLYYFIEMNEAIFAGEYINSDYGERISSLEKELEIEDSKFTNSIKISLSYLKNLIIYINNKIKAPNEKLLFSVFRQRDKSKQIPLLQDFVNITLGLAYADHSFFNEAELKQNLILIRDELQKKKEVDNTDLKNIYEKLHSKCSYLFYKLHKPNTPHKFAIDFKVYNINDLNLLDDYTRDFGNFFDCLKTKTPSDHILQSESKLYKGNLTSIDYILLAHYYRTHQKNKRQLINLIRGFNKFYVRKKKNKFISTFDEYAFDSVRNYLNNCLFALKWSKKDIANDDIELLRKDITHIQYIQKSTNIQNYHPYLKALQFLSIFFTHNGALTDSNIKSFNHLYSEILNYLKESIDWCIQRRFYPIQLEKENCFTQKNIFIASSFSPALDKEVLYQLYQEYSEIKQRGISLQDYLSHKKELENIETDIKSFKRESFQYLGIFSGIITFLFGSIHLFGRTDITYTQSLTNILSLGLVLCIFIALITITIALEKKYRLWGIIFIIVIAIVFLLSLISLFNTI